MCCCACGLCNCGETRPSLSRVFYFLWFLVSTAVAWGLRDYGAPALKLLPWGSDCSDGNDGDSCLGTQAVLRISFANLVFFVAHAVFLIGVKQREDLRLVVHTSLWPLKLLAWGALTAAFFTIPSSILYGYAQVARVLAGLYLVLQLIYLLDFFYRLNGAMVDSSGCAPVLITLTAAAYLTALVGLGFMYYLFAPRASCGLNIFLITFTLILGITCTAVSVLPNRMQESGLFTSSAVFLYCAFLCFSALNSEPNSQGDICQRSAGTQDSWITICGFLITLFAVGWSALSSGSDKETFTFDVAAEVRNEDGEGGDGEELTFSPTIFHAMFTLASAYLAMLLTGWDWQESRNGEFEADKGEVSMWVKIGAQWACVVLYIWTVIAPICLPDRNFSNV